MNKLFFMAAFAVIFSFLQKDEACRGITLKTTNGCTVTARTIEWAGNDIGSNYTIVPRGYHQRSLTPDGKKNGMEFTARYGYIGLAVEQADYVVEGVNEAGLAAGLFYFPDYGEYEPYVEAEKDHTISDFQLVSWILSNFKSIDEMEQAMKDIHVVATDPRSNTVHWRITEQSGRQVVLEIVNRTPKFYENTLGVLTNSPTFDWHLTNLNNYTNLSAGPIKTRKVGDITLTAFGGGGGLHGIPGDMTPPSRFIRAAFFQATAPKFADPQKTVEQAFHILNNFDIPTGIQFTEGQPVPDIPSATQWTVATDLVNRRIYYRTMYNSSIRCFDLNNIDFGKVTFQWAPLDEVKIQPVEILKVR